MVEGIGTKMHTIAYYLGQFHPLDENNRFWGEGFTEWHNVAKARPLFRGHLQPVLPGALGFYDLRCDENLMAQLNLAKEIGINALCHWHYWFAGKRVLHGPFERMLQLPDNGVKLMLGWANESWTGIWHGLDKEVILEQSYNRDELREHAKLLANFVKSDRYLKIDGKAPFLLYKPKLIPNSKEYLDEFRSNVRSYGGGDLYIIGTWGPGLSEQINDPFELGLDAVVANNVGQYFKSKVYQKINAALWHGRRKLGLGPQRRNYLETLDALQAAHEIVDGIVHSTVVTGWDNTPRSSRRGLVLEQYNAANFTKAIKFAKHLEDKNKTKLLFVKSWNEWAEGNVIEPKFGETWNAGKVFLEALKSENKE